MGNNDQYVWRGAYGDKEPARVHMTQALDFAGGLLAEHYQSEAAAWGNILAHAKAGEDRARDRYNKADAALDAAAGELAKRRTDHRLVSDAYKAWRARHPQKAQAV